MVFQIQPVVTPEGMFDSLRNNTASPKSFSPSNGHSFILHLLRQEWKKSFFAIVQFNSLKQGSKRPGTSKNWPVNSTAKANTLMRGDFLEDEFLKRPHVTKPIRILHSKGHTELTWAEQIHQYTQDHKGGKKPQTTNFSTSVSELRKRQQSKHFKV